MEDDELFECPVCCDRFTSAGSRIPRVLPCGHTLCSSCIAALASAASFFCPTCRAVCPVVGGTAGVPNFALISMLSAKIIPKQVGAAAAAQPETADPVAHVPPAASHAAPPPPVHAPAAHPPVHAAAAHPDPPPRRPAPPGARFLTGIDAHILARAPPGFVYDPQAQVYFLPPGSDAQPFAEWLPRKHGSLLGVAFLDVPFSQKDQAKRARKWYVPSGVEGDAALHRWLPSLRVDLDVPFGEKDEAKALGARWDADARVWFCPPGVPVALFERWRVDAFVADDDVAEFGGYDEDGYDGGDVVGVAAPWNSDDEDDEEEEREVKKKAVKKKRTAASKRAATAPKKPSARRRGVAAAPAASTVVPAPEAPVPSVGEGAGPLADAASSPALDIAVLEEVQAAPAVVTTGKRRRTSSAAASGAAAESAEDEATSKAARRVAAAEARRVRTYGRAVAKGQ